MGTHSHHFFSPECPGCPRKSGLKTGSAVASSAEGKKESKKDRETFREALVQLMLQQDNEFETLDKDELARTLSKAGTIAEKDVLR